MRIVNSLSQQNIAQSCQTSFMKLHQRLAVLLFSIVESRNYFILHDRSDVNKVMRHVGERRPPANDVQPLGEIDSRRGGSFNVSRKETAEILKHVVVSNAREDMYQVLG